MLVEDDIDDESGQPEFFKDGSTLDHWQAKFPLVNAHLIQQGAEARVFKLQFLGRNTIVKERFSKKYRHPILDTNITNQRIRAEVRHMVKCIKLGVRAPYVYHIDQHCARIYMEEVHGVTTKQYIDSLVNSNEPEKESKLTELGIAIGKLVGKIHDGNIIHGDLTTSNILRQHNGSLVLIDFGLSYTSTIHEDKAVDLYVLERAIGSTHSSCTFIFDEAVKEYTQVSRTSSSVLSRFRDVRMRGRKRDMIG